jgi:hypothetical protein
MFRSPAIAGAPAAVCDLSALRVRRDVTQRNPRGTRDTDWASRLSRRSCETCPLRGSGVIERERGRSPTLAGFSPTFVPPQA